MNKTTPDSPLSKQARMGTYFAHEQERRRVVREMFDSAAPAYDYAESLTSFGTGKWYRNEALKRAGLKQGMTMLDVACGTGLVAGEAIKILGDPSLLTGLDPTPGMLAEARKLLNIRTIEAFAEQMPVESDHFDFLSMGYALRHLSDLSVVFAEFLRVLKPGGRVLLLEITHPSGALGRGVMRLYIRGVVPLIARMSGRKRAVGKLWEYYYDTIEACVRPEIVVQALERAGFSDVKHHTELGIFSEYTGKKPESSDPDTPRQS